MPKDKTLIRDHIDALEPPNHALIQSQMRKILSSDEFDATEQQRNFFTFVVTETLAGRQQTIKGYTIATQVFGRAPDFNASMDPIVSMQANKLRRSLERYYLLVGYRDPVRIDIPKGGYVPTFNEQSIVEPNARLNEEVMRTDLMVSWPSVLVLPFKNMTESPSKDFLGIGFSTELAVEIARFQEITVLFPLEGEIETVSANKYRFVLGGIIYEHGNTIKIIAHMIDTRTGEQIWGDSHKSNLDTGGFYAFQEKVVPVIAAKIGGEVGVIPKLLAIESRTKVPIELSTYEAILRFYEYEQTLAPENFLRAMEALKQARNADPECDQIWSLLARLYGIIYSLDISGFENPLEKAVAYAEKGVHMNPNNQRK